MGFYWCYTLLLYVTACFYALLHAYFLRQINTLWPQAYVNNLTVCLINIEF